MSDSKLENSTDVIQDTGGLKNEKSQTQKKDFKMNSKYKTADKRKFQKNKFKSKDKEAVKSGTKYHNDISWYVRDKSMIDAVGAVSFNWLPGLPRLLTSTNSHVVSDVVTGTNNATTNKDNKVLIANSVTPSVMRLGYHPISGTSISNSSGLSIATRALYTYVRDKNAGARNYEAPDLMMYILAMDQIYLMYHEARRIYQAINTYITSNRWFPHAILRATQIHPAYYSGTPNTAIGSDYSLADYRAQLNLIKNKINSLVVPKQFSVFLRRAYLASNIFSDDKDMSGQFYIFEADSYGYYDTTSNQGTAINQQPKVVYNTYSGGRATNTYITAQRYQTLRTIVQRLNFALEIVLADQDFGIMAGDILKAFGNSNLYSLSEIAEGEQLNVVYDETILQQIKNATFWQPMGQVEWVPLKQESLYTNRNSVNVSIASSTTAVWPMYAVGSDVFAIARGLQSTYKLNGGNISSLSTVQSNNKLICCPIFAYTTGADGSPDNSEIFCPSPAGICATVGIFNQIPLINFKHSNAMTNEEVIESTRLTAMLTAIDPQLLSESGIFNADSINAFAERVISCGTELMTRMSIIRPIDQITSDNATAQQNMTYIGRALNQVYAWDSNLSQNSGLCPLNGTMQGSGIAMSNDDTDGFPYVPFNYGTDLACLASFNWAPAIYNISNAWVLSNGTRRLRSIVFDGGKSALPVLQITNDRDDEGGSGYYGTINPITAYTNMTTISPTTLTNMHDVCLQGLFAADLIQTYGRGSR